MGIKPFIKLRKGLFLFPIFMLLAMSWALWKGAHYYKEREKSQQEKAGERSYLENITLTSVKDGKLMWKLSAKKAKVKGSNATVWGVKIRYIYKDQKPMIIAAEEGELDKKSGVGIMKRDVRISYGSEVLYTTQVKWRFDQDVIETSEPFYVEGRYHVEGVGFLAKPRVGWVHVKKLKRAIFLRKAEVLPQRAKGKVGPQVSLKEKREEIKRRKVKIRPIPSKEMQVVLTSSPPTKLEEIEALLEKKGIRGKREERKTPCIFYRVTVGGVKDPKSLGELRRRLKLAMPHVSPWRLKDNNLYYLNVASLRNMREAQTMEKRLESLGFQVNIKEAKVALKMPVLTFKVEKGKWEEVKKEVPPQKMQILKELYLSSGKDLSQCGY